MPSGHYRDRAQTPLASLQRLLLCLILAFVVVSPANARNVLILVDNDLDSRFSTALQDRLSLLAQQSENHIYVHEIPTDYDYLVNGEAPGLTNQLAAMLRLRFSANRMSEAIVFDEIIAQGTAPGQFLDDVPDLFPNAERSFFHILWQPKTGSRYPSDIDAVESFELIQEVFPNTRKVVLYHVIRPGWSVADTQTLEFLFQQAWSNHWMSFFEFEIQNLLASDEDLLTHAQSLPKGSAAIYVLYRDTHPPAPGFHKWLMNQSQLPVFGLFEHNIDQFFGGAVISANKLAEALVAKANQSQTRFRAEQVTRKVVTFKQLARFGLSVDDVPEPVEVMGLPANQIDRDSVLIMVGGLLALILALTVVLALLYRAKLLAQQAESREVAKHAADQQEMVAKLRLTRELSSIGEWFWDLQGDCFTLDSMAASLVGVEELCDRNSDTALSPSGPDGRVIDWKTIVHPQDHGILENFLQCIKAGLHESHLTIRIVRNDGVLRIISVSGATLERNADEQAIGIRGLMRDVTDSVETRQQLLNDNRHLRQKIAELEKALQHRDN